MINNVTKTLLNSCTKKIKLKQLLEQPGYLGSGVRDYTVCEMNKDIYKKFDLPQRLNRDKNVWVEYIKLANEFNPINLGQGFPDFFPPEHIVKALQDASMSESGELHQYTRSFGHPRLVKALARLYSKLVKHDIDPMEEIIVGVGATQVLFNIFIGHLQEGDEAIVIEPYFDCYKPMIELAGAKPVYIALKPKFGETEMTTRNWVLDKDELAKLFNEKTKMIIVNTPHNPIGKVYTRDELLFIGDLCKKWNALCIADEVYEWIVYKPNEHVRMASLPGMWERTITLGSAGKSFSVTGWKIGWAYGPAHLMRNLQVVHVSCVYTCASILQEALAIGFEHEIQVFGTSDSYFEQIKKELEPKRDFMAKALLDVGMKPIIPEGGYFMVADWTPLLPKIDLTKEGDTYRDYKFTKWMTKNIGVLTIPPSSFYSVDHKSLGENYARFCFIKKDINLQKAADRMLDWRAKNK